MLVVGTRLPALNKQMSVQATSTVSMDLPAWYVTPPTLPCYDVSPNTCRISSMALSVFVPMDLLEIFAHLI